MSGRAPLAPFARLILLATPDGGTVVISPLPGESLIGDRAAFPRAGQSAVRQPRHRRYPRRGGTRSRRGDTVPAGVQLRDPRAWLRRAGVVADPVPVRRNLRPVVIHTSEGTPPPGSRQVGPGQLGRLSEHRDATEPCRPRSSGPPTPFAGLGASSSAGDHGRRGHRRLASTRPLRLAMRPCCCVRPERSRFPHSQPASRGGLLSMINALGPVRVLALSWGGGLPRLS